MTVSRVLPAKLPPRFGNAQRATCTVGDGSSEVVVAEQFFLRLRGLAGLDADAIVPLLFPRCRSLHTFGMRAPIDVVWLELGPAGEGEIRAVETAIAPRRSVRAPRGASRRGTAALELPAGDAEALGMASGVRLTIKS